MPVALTYPGVYVEEIPSGVRTIVGVPTSIASFVGRALRGPVNVATVINNYGDFDRIFGGLWIKSSLGFAVRDFFLNGGGQAIVVRLFHTDTAQNSPPSRTPLSIGTVTMEAAYEGSWGRNLRAAVDAQVSQQAADAMGVALTDLFNIRIVELGPEGIPVRTEVFRNVTLKNSPRRIDNVLKAESKLLQWTGQTLPPALTVDFHTPDKDLQLARKDLATELAKPAPDPAVTAAAEAKIETALAALTDNISTAERGLAAAKKALAADPGNQTKQTAVTTAEGKLTAATATSDGGDLVKLDFTPNNGETDKKGLFALADADLFNILCIPPYLASGDVDPGLIAEAAVYCEKRRAMLLVDPPSTWKTVAKAKSEVVNAGTNSKNAAIYFPRLRQPNPLHDDQLEDFVPCGAVAGIFARTDTTRGVWKAPAGMEATLVGVPQLSVPLTDAENGELNPLGVNCLRAMVPAGRIVWGARTMQGDDRFASEWKYVPVRRTALFIEESLYRGTQWVVFEPNDEPLWAQIRLNVGAFMHNLFRQGAFQGTTPKEAYFVKCDKSTTTQADINLGIVNIVVGFAPLKPAEFVIIKLQQMAGQIET